MDLQNMNKIHPSVELTQNFEKDGVHLTATSGKVFIVTILSSLEEFFAARFIDLEMEVDGSGPNLLPLGTVETKDKSNEIAKRIARIEKEIVKPKEG